MTKYQTIKRELKNRKELIACAQQLGVVGDATRLKICYLLCCHPEVNVSDIAEILDTSVSVVSHSVKKLLELELVSRRKDAQTVYYSLADNDFNKTLKNFII
ncbi:winged helix-turn-helix transcriptional regulator [Candidatus Gottesmanbacteria bacterium]|nr:winged helix-turn-helix transcriptional regulator [Candidatus Gottesmanbacteria bacterium]